MSRGRRNCPADFLLSLNMVICLFLGRSKVHKICTGIFVIFCSDFVKISLLLLLDMEN